MAVLIQHISVNALCCAELAKVLSDVAVEVKHGGEALCALTCREESFKNFAGDAYIGGDNAVGQPTVGGVVDDVAALCIVTGKTGGILSGGNAFLGRSTLIVTCYPTEHTLGDSADTGSEAHLSDEGLAFLGASGVESANAGFDNLTGVLNSVVDDGEAVELCNAGAVTLVESLLSQVKAHVAAVGVGGEGEHIDVNVVKSLQKLDFLLQNGGTGTGVQAGLLLSLVLFEHLVHVLVVGKALVIGNCLFKVDFLTGGPCADNLFVLLQKLVFRHLDVAYINLTVIKHLITSFLYSLKKAFTSGESLRSLHWNRDHLD